MLFHKTSENHRMKDIPNQKLSKDKEKEINLSSDSQSSDEEDNQKTRQ